MQWKGETMNWYLAVLKQYAAFDGRASRTEYWMFQLFNLIAAVVLAVLGAFLGKVGSALIALYALGTLLPSLAVLIRRLHDTGRSGWWILIALVPGVGGLVLLVFTLLDSQAGDNEFGPNPHPLSAP
jgi:uncharacterized membrane protein YhaH (DUF805 family)